MFFLKKRVKTQQIPTQKPIVDEYIALLRIERLYEERDLNENILEFFRLIGIPENEIYDFTNGSIGGDSFLDKNIVSIRTSSDIEEEIEDFKEDNSIPIYNGKFIEYNFLDSDFSNSPDYFPLQSKKAIITSIYSEKDYKFLSKVHDDALEKNGYLLIDHGGIDNINKFIKNLPNYQLLLQINDPEYYDDAISLQLKNDMKKEYGGDQIKLMIFKKI